MKRFNYKRGSITITVSPRAKLELNRMHEQEIKKDFINGIKTSILFIRNLVFYLFIFFAIWFSLCVIA